MSAPEAAPGTERKKGNKPLIFILVGCGGCLLLSGIAVVVLAVVLPSMAKRGIAEMEESSGGLVALQLVAQQMTLATQLMNDEARSKRVEAVYDELYDMADAGELKASDVKKIQDELDKAEKDKKITGDEADKILEIAEDITGS